MAAARLAAELERTGLYVKPDRRDRVFQAARVAIITYNRRSLAHFTNPSRVEAVTTSPTTFMDLQSNSTTLAILCEGSAERLEFKVIRPKKRNEANGTVMCKEAGKWLPFEEWLDLKPAPPSRAESGQKGTFQQSQWWAKNGKVFRFLDLPAELRENVYEKFFPDTLVFFIDAYWNRNKNFDKDPSRQWEFGYNLSTKFFTFGTGSSRHWEYGHLDHTKKEIEAPGNALLRTCTKVNKEVEHFLWTKTRKCFETAFAMQIFLDKTFVAEPAFNNLRSLELNMSNKEYMHLFKVEVEPFPRTQDWGLAGLGEKLLQLDKVVDFTIRFDSPFDAMLKDPWGYEGRHNGFEWYQDYAGARDRNGFHTSCQKFVVDWILTYAFDFIKHFPKITFAGAIKNSTKTKWDLRIKEHKSGIVQDEGIAAEKEVIANWPTAFLPPKCFCTTPCEHEEFRATAHTCSMGTCGESRGCPYRYGESDKKRDARLKKYRFDFED